jgi:hypothetical protein
MFIVWSGKGILVVLIIGLACAVGVGFVSLLASSGIVSVTESDVAGYGMPLGLLVGAAGNYYLARWVDDPARHRTLVDAKTGQAYLFKDGSSLMFIPVRYWTFILAAGSLLLIVGKLTIGR